MNTKRLHKYFALFITFLMVLSMLSPLNVLANEDSEAFKQSNFDESTMLTKAAIAEQLQVSTGPATLHRDLQGISGSEEIPVIIHLSEKPVALEQGIMELNGRSFSSNDRAKRKARVTSQQAKVIKEMHVENVSFSQGYTFDTVLNGFAATVKADDIERLIDIEGITLVEPDTIMYASEDVASSGETSFTQAGQVSPFMNTSNSFLGIEKLWAEGIEGQGIKVAVLDTGIDTNHPEFAGIYKGGKNFVPHTGSDYARPRSDDDASETSPLDRPANRAEFNANGSAFYTSHGTHVAGTIAAIGANDFGIKGIAPKVDLYMYRVLGAYGSGSNSGIIKAIETAVIEDMDVINLSLGGGANSETDGGSFALNNAMMAGTIAVSATGNSGPNRGTIGTPATSRLGIAVGNTTNPETMHNGEVNIAIGDYEFKKQLELMATTFGQDVATQLDGEFEIVAVPGVGNLSDYNGIDVEGKIALIARGTIAFVDKIANAKEMGAVGTIIHNIAGGTNAPNASGVFLGDSFEFIPSFDMSQTDGAAIRAALATEEGAVMFDRFGSVTTVGDEVNDSSSRGPTTPNFDIKPDVSAPGTNIMSAVPMYKADFPDASYDEAYGRKTGTSMATPHIAGIAALVKQANPSWSAFDVKVALSNTAKVLNTAQFDVFEQGAGRVDAYAAAHPSALAYAIDEAVLDSSGTVVENLKGTVTFGPQSLKEGNISITKQILVKDMKGIGGRYNVSVDVTKGFADATVTVDKPTFTLNGEELLTVTLTASQNTATTLGDEMFGYIYITAMEENLTDVSLSVDRSDLNMKIGENIQLNVLETTTPLPSPYTQISLPFAADFGGVAPVEIKNMAISKTDLSFNGDGINDSATLAFTLTGDVTTNYIELWDIMNPEGGIYEDGYIGYLHASNSLVAGSYTLPITGLYQPWSGGARVMIPDGLYTIDFTGLAATGVVSDYAGPVVVKTTKPEISGAITDGIASGQIMDKYIDYNVELARYGLDYDLNEKLSASYVITENDVAADAVPFNLNQNGSFSFDMSTLNEESHNIVTVFVQDAAGNKGSQVIFESEIVSPEQPKAPETPETPETPEAPEEPETPEATEESGEPDTEELAVAKKSVMRVASTKSIQSAALEQELITPQNTPELTPEVETEDINSIEIESLPNLTLIAPIITEQPYSGGTIEMNQNSDGPARYTVLESPTVVDVTQKATYTVADKNIITVTNKGLVTAKKAGTTTITVNYRGNEVKVRVTVTKQVKPSKPSKPEKPGKPENPGKPDKPDKPDPGKPDPGKPDKPDPGKPDKPDPGKPDKPDPGKPDKPDPGKPDKPDPGKPDKPDPGKPDKPDPGKPGNSGNPSNPGKPGKP
ncbi:S8 family serine peptidase [Lysinibacillus sp. S2017]|uniref:S8 family serine peptidase n=1 Tax=Lysinibacillus sp. S2017 TaxID=2561923 RepID=UPI0035141939